MTVLTAPGTEMQPQGLIPPFDPYLISRRKASEGALDEDVGAPAEAQRLKVDSRPQ